MFGGQLQDYHSICSELPRFPVVHLGSQEGQKTRCPRHRVRHLSETRDAHKWLNGRSCRPRHPQLLESLPQQDVISKEFFEFDELVVHHLFHHSAGDGWECWREDEWLRLAGRRKHRWHRQWSEAQMSGRLGSDDGVAGTVDSLTSAPVVGNNGMDDINAAGGQG